MSLVSTGGQGFTLRTELVGSNVCSTLAELAAGIIAFASVQRDFGIPKRMGSMGSFYNILVYN